MFVKITEKINVNINPSQIHQIYRKKTRKLKNGMPPTIIVKLSMNVKEGSINGATMTTALRQLKLP
jgi:hypothetical protein